MTRPASLVWGARAGVAVRLLADLVHVGVVLLLGLEVEVADQRVAVVLFDDLPDLGRAGVQLAGQLDAFLDVVDDDQRAHAGRQVLVDVELLVLVLDEVLGHLDLADVVVEGPGLDQQGVDADLLGRLLGQRGDDQRVVVGAGRLERPSGGRSATRSWSAPGASTGSGSGRRFRRSAGG